MRLQYADQSTTGTSASVAWGGTRLTSILSPVSGTYGASGTTAASLTPVAELARGFTEAKAYFFYVGQSGATAIDDANGLRLTFTQKSDPFSLMVDDTNRQRKITQSSNVWQADAWFAEAIRIERIGDLSRALDIVYQTLDEWLYAGNDGEVAAFVKRQSPESLSVDMIIAILAMTRAAGEKVIPAREEFFERAWKSLGQRKRNPGELLAGLRSGRRRAGQATSHGTSSVKSTGNGRGWGLFRWFPRWNSSSPT
jgi:hypothetical protein